MSSALMRSTHSIFGRLGLSTRPAGRAASLGLVPAPRPSPGPRLGRFVQVYCDDIFIFTKTREEHLAHVRMALETLLHHKLYVKASKCLFGLSSRAVGFLGHGIAECGVVSTPVRSPPWQSTYGPKYSKKF